MSTPAGRNSFFLHVQYLVGTPRYGPKPHFYRDLDAVLSNVSGSGLYLRIPSVIFPTVRIFGALGIWQPPVR